VVLSSFDPALDRPAELSLREGRRRVVPRAAAGVELLGPLESSGYAEPPWLVRRADGQTLQLTPVLYAVLELIDGERDLEAIRSELARRQQIGLDTEDLVFLIDERLQPLGVLVRPDGAEPSLPRANPLLGIRGRLRVVDPARTDRLCRRFTRLFRPPVVALVVMAFVASAWFVFATEGLGAALHDLFHQPGALLAVIGLTIVSAGFHEVGHAAACRYGGARPGAMGAGLYLMWPAFYTDVSDSYRLSRAGRLRVDLGGLYFNAVFSVGTFVAWAATGWDPLLVLFVLQLLQMVRQLTPLVRFDGYHVLADLVGVPDLFGRIKPVLRGWLPFGHRPEAQALKPWARAVITAWVLVVVPILAFSLLVMVVTLPRLAATAAESIRSQSREVVDHWASADLAQVALAALAIVAIALPVVGITYLVVRTARRAGTRAWRMTDGNPRARRALVLGSLGLGVALAMAWWPQGQYEPISRDEDLTLPMVTGWIADAARGDLDLEDAELASSTSSDAPAQRATAVRHDVRTADAPSVPEGPAGGHVFPAPPPPGDGDNQAVAIGYDDGQTVTDTSTSLVWETDGAVDNRNESYALASCRDCRTMAVAFQVVLVVGQHDEIAPLNKAVALNERCAACTTRSLAVQLVLPLEEEPDAETRAQLDALWGRAGGIDSTLRSEGFDAARALVLDIEADIAALLELDDDLAEATSTSIAARSTTTTLGSETPSTAEATGTTAGEGTTTSTEPTSTTTPAETTTTASTSTTAPPTTSTTAPP
jgi:putative peptide zinc metalloprotease protein